MQSRFLRLLNESSAFEAVFVWLGGLLFLAGTLWAFTGIAAGCVWVWRTILQ